MKNDSVETIKNRLLAKYKIDAFVFIEDLEVSASSTLHKTLSPLVQTAYQPDYRFVFFNFQPVDNQTLIHIYKIITFLDISPWFVLVITNQTLTQQYFSSLPEPITVDFTDTNIHNRSVSHRVTPLFNNTGKMCAYAWSGIHVNPSGTCQVCCLYTDTIKDSNGQEFSIKTHNINDIVNSKYLANVRRLFRRGITPVECNQCEVEENNGEMSKRMTASFKLKNIYGDIDWESESQFRWISGWFGNLCNLKCRICNENFSSSIAAEKLKQVPVSDIRTHQAYQTLKNNNWNSKNNVFWQSVKAFPDIKNFEILGGEPLLAEANLQFMQDLIDTGQSQDSVFEFVTNGTQWNDVLEQAYKFKEFRIIVSIDNIKEMFELERSGGKWSTVDENLSRMVALQQQHPSIKVGVSVTVSIQNVLYLPQLIEYLNQKQVCDYGLNILRFPKYLSISMLTTDAKKLVLDTLESANLSNTDKDHLQRVIRSIKRSRTSDGKEFCKYMTQLDLIRKEKFLDTHKEIAQAMGL